MISILTAASTTDHVPFADLYVWIAIDAALYCSALAVFGYFAAVGAAYAIALALSRGVTDPWVTWMATIGTVVVAASIVFGLVSVLRMNAKEDPLTGLANRRSWDEHLDGELARSRRTGVPVSVALFDLDGFKAINDTQGHDAGDRLLQELAQTWTAAARGGGDLLARLGGDEFGLLVPGSDEAGIRRLTKRLSQLLPHAVTASVGIATWDRSESASNLLRRADQAMYRAKRQRGTGRPPI
jgi:diguanylate cyclase (GGDEF)-like protein